MNDSHIEILEQARQFLDGAASMEISIPSKIECYCWIQGALVRFEYLTFGKDDNAVLKDRVDSTPTAYHERFRAKSREGIACWHTLIPCTARSVA